MAIFNKVAGFSDENCVMEEINQSARQECVQVIEQPAKGLEFGIALEFTKERLLQRG